MGQPYVHVVHRFEVELRGVSVLHAVQLDWPAAPAVERPTGHQSQYRLPDWLVLPAMHVLQILVDVVVNLPASVVHSPDSKYLPAGHVVPMPMAEHRRPPGHTTQRV